MSEADETLTLATASDVAHSLAFALRYDGRRRVHDAAETMSMIVAKRLVEHLKISGFVIMQRPPVRGAAHLGSSGGPVDPAKMP